MSQTRPGGRERTTPDEKAQVRRLLTQLAEISGGWEELAYRAGIKHTTMNGWRYGGHGPNAHSLMKLLQAARVLNGDLLLANYPPPGLTDAQLRKWVQARAEIAASDGDGQVVLGLRSTTGSRPAAQ